MAEIAIIGSGPAGLMAAWRAAELGHEIKVLNLLQRLEECQEVLKLPDYA